MNRLIPIMLCPLLYGCSIMPSSKTSTQDSKAAGSASSQHESTLRRVTEGVQRPSPNIDIKICNSSNIVIFAPPARAVPMTPEAPFHEELTISDDAGMTSESSMTWSKLSKIVIPLGVKLLLLAGGILALILVFKYARRTSPAVDAIIGTVDNVIANKITRHQETAMGSTDPAVIALAQAKIAALQEERVKLRESKPK